MKGGGDRIRSRMNAFDGIVFVERNVYVEREERKLEEADVPVCSCVSPAAGVLGCNDDGCINRVCRMECDSAFCPCGVGCQNQRIQRNEGPSMELVDAGGKGVGVAVVDEVAPNAFIGEYVGEVISRAEYHRRRQQYGDDGHQYCMALDGGEVIDATKIGGWMRFVNHSCDPNCRMEKWQVGGEERRALFSLKHLRRKEEVTFDYRMTSEGLEKRRLCLCGSSRCCSSLIAPSPARSKRRTQVDHDALQLRGEMDAPVSSRGDRTGSHDVEALRKVVAVLEVVFGSVSRKQVLEQSGHRCTNVGEVLPVGVAMILSAVGRVESGDVFVDIGAGIGNVVVQVAAQTMVARSIGIEMRRDLYDIAIANVRRCSSELVALRRVEMIHGEVGCVDFTSSPYLARSSIVFANNVLFEATTNEYISDLVCDLGCVRVVILFRDVCPRHRRWCQSAFCRRFKKIASVQVPVSWTCARVSVFVYKRCDV